MYPRIEILWDNTYIYIYPMISNDRKIYIASIVHYNTYVSYVCIQIGPLYHFFRMDRYVELDS